MKTDELLNLLRTEMRPALGCTEPAAVALAAAIAARQLGGQIRRVQIKTDPNVYKNGMGVYVPGTNRYGLKIAAAVGAVGGDPSLELQVLKAATSQDIAVAEQLIARRAVEVAVHGDPGRLLIEATVFGDNGTATAVISDSHTHLSRLVVNGEERYREIKTVGTKANACLLGINFWDYCQQILSLPTAELDYVVQAAEMNVNVAQAGFKHALGMALGAKYQQLMAKGLLAQDMANQAMAYTAAASDARMQGWPEPVMSVNGSGNQGITVTLPVWTVGHALHKSGDEIAHALALSEGIALYVKQHIGKLSAICACAVAAAIGAGCGVAYLLGGGRQEIEATFKNIAANLTGMICDGAKVGCSFKLATAANCAVVSAMLSMQGVEVTATDGIVADTVEATAANLGQVSNPGMVETDRVILDVMVCKQRD
ncbi:MAG: serine dehydratase subunit alpha family protein [Bacillota bacterium]